MMLRLSGFVHWLVFCLMLSGGKFTRDPCCKQRHVRSLPGCFQRCRRGGGPERPFPRRPCPKTPVCTAFLPLWKSLFAQHNSKGCLTFLEQDTLSQAFMSGMDMPQKHWHSQRSCLFAQLYTQGGSNPPEDANMMAALGAIYLLKKKSGANFVASLLRRRYRGRSQKPKHS